MPLRASPIPSSLAATWPLTGRDAELAQITAARADLGCRGVVVGAAAGIGKSRLARGACDAAEAGGAMVSWVQATNSAAAVPLGAFAGLLPDAVRTDDVLELMRRSVDSLREHAAGRPVVLAVDDAQLLDPVSAALVLHLTVSESAFVVATVRSGEPCPDAIVSLWKDSHARRLELARLGDEAVGAMVEAALGGPVEQGVLRWLCDSSQGNALYVRELVLGALEAGTLTQRRGLWQMTSTPSMSRSVAELVAERMAGLTDSERAVLELLALGEPLTLDELVGLTDYESLVAAEARGIVVVGPPASGSEVRIAHPLYGEVVRRDMPALRARELRVRLAAAVRRRDPLAPDDAMRVARWLLDAGETIPIDLLVDAAHAANRSDHPELGAQLAELAVAGGAGWPAVLILARAYILRKRFADAERVLAEVEGTAQTQDAAIDYLEQRVMPVLYFGLQRPGEASALLARAEQWWPGSEWQRRLDPIRLSLASLVDGFAGTVEVSGKILSEPELGEDARRQLEPMHALALFFTGRVKDAYALAHRIRPPVPVRDQSDMLALAAWGLIAIQSGEDWPELHRYMTSIMRDAVRGGDHEAAGNGALALGYMAFMGGRYRDATRWLAEAELHFERQDAFGSLVIVRSHQAGVARLVGDASEVAAAVERLREALGGHEPIPTQLPTTMRAEAWFVHRQGDPLRAQQMLIDAAAQISDIPPYATLLSYEAMRAGAPARQIVDALTASSARCDSRLCAAYTAHAVAAAAGDSTALMAVADEFAAIGTRRYATEAAVDAATLFIAEGRSDSARRAAAAAREFHVPGHGTEPPVIAGLDPGAVTLTARETQLVELASRGMSNAEIADQLVLSVRTVETHIYRAMQKLGVSDRRDL